MEIYIINICVEWLYKLYIDYIENLIIFIKQKFQINIHTIFINENENYINNFKKYYNDKNKYIFSGNIDSINNLFDKYKNYNFYF